MRRHLNLVSSFRPLVFKDAIFSLLERGFGVGGLVKVEEVEGSGLLYRLGLSLEILICLRFLSREKIW